jgi:hypothetical protein
MGAWGLFELRYLDGGVDGLKLLVADRVVIPTEFGKQLASLVVWHRQEARREGATRLITKADVYQRETGRH